MRSLLAIVGVSFVLACTDGTSAKTEPTKTEAKTEPAKTEAKAETKVPPPKREWPADTPSAIDCTTHEDCTVVPVAPGADPCCDDCCA